VSLKALVLAKNAQWFSWKAQYDLRSLDPSINLPSFFKTSYGNNRSFLRS